MLDNYDHKRVNEKETIDNVIKALEFERDKHLERLTNCAERNKFVEAKKARDQADAIANVIFTVSLMKVK